MKVFLLIFLLFLDHLPDSIQKIKFGEDLKISIPEKGNINNYIDYLPRNLTHMIVNCDCTFPLDNLPESLKYLSFNRFVGFYDVRLITQQTTNYKQRTPLIVAVAG